MTVALLTPRGLRLGGQTYPCTIGRSGVSRDKREGDGATPAGRFAVAGLLYRPDRVSKPAPWAQPIRPGDLWCDDVKAADYNHLVRAPFAQSHEVLRRADPLYDLILVTTWNWPQAVPGRGSAIFLHRWRRPGAPTEGCIALHPDHLRRLVPHLSPGTEIHVPRSLAARP